LSGALSPSERALFERLVEAVEKIANPPYIITMSDSTNPDPDMPHCGDPKCGCPTNAQMDSLIRAIREAK
jgi:hypothetical protein